MQRWHRTTMAREQTRVHVDAALGSCRYAVGIENLVEMEGYDEICIDPLHLGCPVGSVHVSHGNVCDTPSPTSFAKWHLGCADRPAQQTPDDATYTGGDEVSS